MKKNDCWEKHRKRILKNDFSYQLKEWEIGIAILFTAICSIALLCYVIMTYLNEKASVKEFIGILSLCCLLSAGLIYIICKEGKAALHKREEELQEKFIQKQRKRNAHASRRTSSHTSIYS